MVDASGMVQVLPGTFGSGLQRLYCQAFLRLCFVRLIQVMGCPGSELTFRPGAPRYQRVTLAERRLPFEELFRVQGAGLRVEG